MDEDIRRRRRADLRDELDRIPERQGGSESFLAKVFDAGHLPTGAMKYYACHPVEVAGAEAEGTLATFTVGAAEVEVAVLNGSPSVGDILVARRTGNRWVAERPGSALTCFTGRGCLPGTVDVTITVVDNTDGSTVGTCTTNPAYLYLCCWPLVNGRSYTATASSPGYTTGTYTFTAGPSQPSVAVGLAVDLSQSQGCCGTAITTGELIRIPYPTPLYLTPANAVPFGIGPHPNYHFSQCDGTGYVSPECGGTMANSPACGWTTGISAPLSAPGSPTITLALNYAGSNVWEMGFYHGFVDVSGPGGPVFSRASGPPSGPVALTFSSFTPTPVAGSWVYNSACSDSVIGPPTTWADILLPMTVTS